MRPAYFDALCVESEPVELIERLRATSRPPATSGRPTQVTVTGTRTR